ncbi:hypothetical protein [Paenibacillus sp. FSL K6-2862]|uniref:hypothetical protein n=1 Tax=Paenibacillus sp. FSL K6-2862 TaxID=2921484 RepID=UPI0030FC05AA
MNSPYKKIEYRPSVLQAGERLPNIFIRENGTYLYDYIKDEYLMIILLSVSCRSCESALESLLEFSNENKDPNVLILIDAPEKDVHHLRSIFKGFHVYPFNSEEMKTHLRTGTIPWLYSIDKEGSIIKSYVCGSDYYNLAIPPYADYS